MLKRIFGVIGLSLALLSCARADVIGTFTSGGIVSPTFKGVLGQSSIGRSDDGTQQRGLLFSPIPNFAPVVGDLTTLPATNTVGETRTFTLTVSDANGASDIASVWLLANTSLDWSQGATLVYLPASNQLYLRDTDHFNGPITVGAAGTLSNRAVTVDGQRVVVSRGTDGQSLTLSLPLQTKVGIIGSNTMWGRVEDASGAVDANAPSGQLGFINKGTWTVNANSGTQVPTSFLQVASQSAGKGTTTTVDPGVETNFTLSVNDPDGLANLDSGWLMINEPGKLDWGGGVTVVYNTTSQQLWLRSTDGQSWMGGQKIGIGTGTLENDAVSIRLAGCSVQESSTGAEVNLPLTFKLAYSPPVQKQMWSRVQDKEGQVSASADASFGFATEGTLNIRDLRIAPQASVRVAGQNAGKNTTTALTTGAETTLTLSLSDGNGVGDLESGWILANDPNNLDWAHGLTLVYAVGNRHIYLRSSDGQSWLDGGVVGQGTGTLENDAAIIRLAGCSVTTTAQGVTVTVAATPKAGFTGLKQMWSRVQDNEGLVAAGNDAALGFNTEGQLTIDTGISTTGSSASGS